MRSWIDHSGEVVWEPSPSLVTQLVEAGQPFWLDIENPTDELIDELATRLGLHPLVVEDSKQFSQQAKLQVYGNGVMLVGFGLDEQLREPVEVHCYYTTGFLITLRRAPSPALDALRQAGSVQPQLGSDPIRALHPLISSLYTQFSALALELDERLDALERRVLHDADDQELARDHRDTLPGRGHQEDPHARPGPRRSDAANQFPARRHQRHPPVRRRHQRRAAASRGRLHRDRGARCRLAGPARLARKQTRSGREPPARGCGRHLPAHLLPGRLLEQNFDVLTGSIEKGWPAFLVLGVGLSVACVVAIVFTLSRRSWR
jgi:magnesium transporter